MKMKYKILLIFLILSYNLFSQEKITMEEVQNVIETMKQIYAPDARTAILNLEIKQEENGFFVMGETNIPKAKEVLSEKLKELNTSIKLEISELPSEELGDKIFGVVNISVANIRTKPEHSAEMATQALLGTPLKIYKKKGGWFMVQTPDDYIGWLDDDGFSQMNKVEFDIWNNSEKIIVTNKFGFSFSGKDENSVPVSDLVAGNILKFKNVDDSFTEVEYPDGRIAFIPFKHVQNYHSWLKSLEINQKNLISTAKSFMGLPYLWGGTSAKGVDCSGFTKTIYFLNGVLLPRDASQQVNVGELVDTENGFDNILPGDLLFFGRKADGDKKERATHVGMYIGDTEFIHSSGMVKINSLDSSRENFSEYRFKSFIRAKRIISSLDKNGVKLLSNYLFK
ncbi:MAG: C40 family peptidase [Ignavibacteria bacterium]|nr:C40 family peptidase [Ignavibacteria bacterium]